MSVFDKLHQLHLGTLPETATWRDKSFLFMSNRLFKYPRYCGRLNVGQIQEVSNKTLIVAFIMGMRDLQERKNGKFAATDEWIECDERFYMGIWEIICDLYSPEGKYMDPPVPVSDNRQTILGADGSITKYNLVEKCDEYLSFAMVNDVEGITSRNKTSYLFNLPKKWLALHNELDKQSPRDYPVDKLLMVMLGMFRLDFLAKPAPVPNYWIDYAYLTWEKIYFELQEELDQAAEQRRKFLDNSK